MAMEKDFKNKKIGIWGFGVVGKSAMSFLYGQGAKLSILDKRPLDPFEKKLLDTHTISSVGQEFLPSFLEMNDYILPSPGIDLSAYSLYAHKWITELDLFFSFYKKPVIAITGSIGKTTTVHVITHLLNALGKKTIACGNIGTGMLDAIAQQDQYDYCVLELSSFQLEYARLCKPHIALITNIFPNHLDRHQDFNEYVAIKSKIASQQDENDALIAPLELAPLLMPLSTYQTKKWIVSCPEEKEDRIMALSDIDVQKPRGWELIVSVFQHLSLPTDDLETHLSSLSSLEHRMEYLGCKNNISFYNDSKATIMESTLSALDLLAQKKVSTLLPVLFLGGLSKGVNRLPFIATLKNKVSTVFCFGAEAQQLNQWCIKNKLQSSAHQTLEDAFKAYAKQARAGDSVLFSPGGSSYDLFKDYQERGATFKKLVHAYADFSPKNK